MKHNDRSLKHLFDCYPDVIRDIKNQAFTSHQFILQLAREHQREYAEALYALRNEMRSGRPTPFLALHRILATELGSYPRLVEKIGVKKGSKDIFGNTNSATIWRKI